MAATENPCLPASLDGEARVCRLCYCGHYIHCFGNWFPCDHCSSKCQLCVQSIATVQYIHRGSKYLCTIVSTLTIAIGYLVALV